jgi:site-specific recombinase XerD
LYNTVARVSEIIGVRVADVVLDGAACVHLHGKGRKQRSVPPWKSTTQPVCSHALAQHAVARQPPADLSVGLFLNLSDVRAR